MTNANESIDGQWQSSNPVPDIDSWLWRQSRAAVAHTIITLVHSLLYLINATYLLEVFQFR